jgi:uncharacterized membrane protein YozB (DUF420 family)
MIDIRMLPGVNASLNGTCAILLSLGYFFIKKKQIAAHRIVMVSAFLVSILFLSSYLYYHFHAGSTRFTGTGWIRPVYFTLLLTHTVLATAIVPMILVTLWRAWRGQFDKHARIARWTWPLWMYVSVTGVVIYLMLYRLY